jgi:HSP20 family protein
MQAITEALGEVRALHEQLTCRPAPDVPPPAFMPFPPGCDPVAFAIQEVNQLKQAIEQARNEGSAVGGTRWVPPASIYAGPDVSKIFVEIPGVSKDALSVTVSAGELVIRGQRGPVASEGLQPILVEQPYGSFERRFPLPAWCTPESISTRAANGQLEVTIVRQRSPQNGGFQVEIG